MQYNTYKQCITDPRQMCINLDIDGYIILCVLFMLVCMIVCISLIIESISCCCDMVQLNEYNICNDDDYNNQY